MAISLGRPDGRHYDGGWAEGKQHGRAAYTNEKGKVRIGIWNNGHRKQWFMDDNDANMDGVDNERGQ